MIDTGEDVHDAHTDKIEKAGLFQRARPSAGNVHSLMAAGKQILREFAGRDIFDFGIVGVTGRQLVKGLGANLQIARRGAFEGEIVFARACGSLPIRSTHPFPPGAEDDLPMRVVR